MAPADMSSETLNFNERDGLRRDLRFGAPAVLVASALLLRRSSS